MGLYGLNIRFYEARNDKWVGEGMYNQPSRASVKE